jgi:hypothetical protein
MGRINKKHYGWIKNEWTTVEWIPGQILEKSSGRCTKLTQRKSFYFYWTNGIKTRWTINRKLIKSRLKVEKEWKKLIYRYVQKINISKYEIL